VYIWVFTWSELCSFSFTTYLLFIFPVSVEGYSIFVANLPLDATVDQLVQTFTRFGAIKPNGVQVRSYKVSLMFILVKLGVENCFLKLYLFVYVAHLYTARKELFWFCGI
jgi:hypothetical protein